MVLQRASAPATPGSVLLKKMRKVVEEEGKKGIKFKLEPSIADIDKEYHLYFRLTDLNAYNPQSDEF